MSGPLHVQVEGDLRAQIDGRDLHPGDLLPSEATLCERYGVSRSVVRQALASLEAAGLVSKSRGRGTVVTEQRQVHRDVRRSGLRWRADGAGEVRTEVTVWEVVAKPGHVVELPGTEVVRVERVRSLDGEPVSVIRTWLPVAWSEELTREALTDDSLHRLLETRLGRRVVGGRHQVRAVTASAEHARLLGVAAGGPLLLLEGASYDASGELVEVFSTWHRADVVAFDVDTTPLGRPGTDGGAADGVERRLDELTAAVAAIADRVARLS